MGVFQTLLLQLYTFITTDLPNDFFKNSFVSMCLDFFQWLGILIFAISFLLLIVNTVEARAAGEYVNLQTVFLSIFRGFLLTAFSRPLVIFTFDFARYTAVCLVESVSKDSGVIQSIESQAFSGITSTSGSGSGLLMALNLFKSMFTFFSNPVVSFVTIIMTVVTIVVFFQMLALYGMLFIQIITGYLNIAAVMRGDYNTFVEWGREVAASGITFMLEFIFYIAGFAIMDASSLSNLASIGTGLVFIVAAPAIPTALRRWGYSHGSGSARGVVSGLGGAANGALMALTHI